jgi:type II secretory pathway pseudopilin PulG
MVDLMPKRHRHQRGSLYVELLIAITILAVFGVVILSYVTQHNKMQRMTRIRDTANYTASFAARLYKNDFCGAGVVVPGEGTVTISETGIKLFVLPDLPTAGQNTQSFRFRATSAFTPTGGAALNFELLDEKGQTITGKSVPVN